MACRARGIGETLRSTMSVPGTAYAPCLFWDGRKDSQWAQALGPLENALEHGGNRGMYAHVIADTTAPNMRRHSDPPRPLRHGAVPSIRRAGRRPAGAGRLGAMTPEDREAVTVIYTNMGKAIAAYERGLLPADSRFDPFVEALLGARTGAAALTDDEVAGPRLFIGKAQCTNCHNGPLLTNNSFHNTGVPPRRGSAGSRPRSRQPSCCSTTSSTA